ncbi:MAG TPA: TrkA C-terminal domain-containing protein, partial [Streptosporangiaceae bacterium]
TPLAGYQVTEIVVGADSPAAGRALGTLTWPPGWTPVAVLHERTVRDPDPGLTLRPGDRITLLTGCHCADCPQS